MMKRGWKSALVLAVAAGLAIVAATAKTKIAETPEAKQAPEGPPKKILVLAIRPDQPHESRGRAVRGVVPARRQSGVVVRFVPGTPHGARGF